MSPASPFGGVGRTGNEHQSNATRHYEQPDASQAERQAILKSDREAREAHRTYHAMAVGDPDAEGGPEVVGAAPVYGADLPGPAWSRDLAALPPERPTGERIDALNPIDRVWFDPDFTAEEHSK